MKHFILSIALIFLTMCFVKAQSINYPSHTWKKISVKSKIGFVDPEGKVMIEPQFENAGNFSNGAAFVWSYPGREEDKKSVALGEEYKSYERFNLDGNRKTGIIDSTGKYIMEPKVNFDCTQFYEGVAMVQIDHRIEIVDRNGDVIRRESQLKNGDETSVLLKGRFDEKLPVKWCFMTPLKKLVMGPFDDCEYFSEDLAAVRIGQHVGYVNRAGEMVITPRFYEAGVFNEGHAAVSAENGNDKSPGTYGVIDTTGQFIIPPNYQWLGTPSGGRVAFSSSTNTELEYGFLNLKGEVVIEAHYSTPSQFHEGLAAVKINGKMGYINTDGKMVIPAKYRYAGAFQHGTAQVFIGKKKQALINTKGEIVWGPQKP